MDAFDQLDQSQKSGTQPTATGPSATTAPTADAFDQLDAQQNSTASQPTKPALSPDEQASQTRQMMVSGLTGMPTPNMTAEDRAQFEKGKAAGAISVPVVAGATTGATLLSELAMPFAEHISGQILEHGTELATKYPNFVKLASKLVPHLPLSTLAAVTWAYEHFKK